MHPEGEKLDQALNTVQVKAASSNLAEKIIAASKPHTRQEESTSILALIANSLLIFKPIPAMACLLIVGLLSGWYIENDMAQDSFAVEDELVEFIDYELSML